MKRILFFAKFSLFLSVCFLLPSQIFAAPGVSSVSGTWNHKASMTVNGSGFGTKATAAPVVWDDASGNNILDKWDGAWPIQGDNCEMRYTTPIRGILLPHNNITKYIAACGDGGSYDTGQDLLMYKTYNHSFPDYSYISWYQRVDDNWQYVGSDGNFKFFTYTEQAEPYAGDFWYFEYNPGLDYVGSNELEYHFNGLDGNLWFGHAINPTSGAWTKLEMEIRWDRTTSGYIKVWENGRLAVDKTGAITDIAVMSGTIRNIAIGGYQRAQSTSNWRYWADVYLDNTRQRIVLANNSNINSATIKEVQIPSAWNDTSLALTSNLGKFTPGQTAYLFVYDASGTPNTSGYPITIGSDGGDTTPPTSPVNLAATSPSQSSISVSWTASTDAVGVTGYIVERCQDTGCTNFTQVSTPTASPFVDSGLTANTFYNYHVRARDGAGNLSGWSNVVGATTQSATTAPTFTLTANPTSIASGSSSTLTWSAVTNATSCTATGGTFTGTKSTSGGTQSVSLTTTTTYTLSCTGAGGTTNQTATVTVGSGGGSFTLGETTILPIGDSGNGNLLLAQQTTFSQPGTLQSLSFYVTTAAGNLRLGVYDATGPGGGPGALKAQTNSFTSTTGWNTQNVVTPVSLAAGTYWLAYLPSSNSLAFVRDGTGSFRYYSYTFGPMPTTFSTTPTSGTDHWSFYATLTQESGTIVCNTVTTANFSQSAYNSYGAPFDAFQTSTNLVNVQCNSVDVHTVNLTTGITGDTTRIVYTKGYWYDATTTAWRQYTGTCTGALNGEWCQGSVSATITDPNVSTANAANPTYLVGMTCSVQGGSWRCGCRDTSCTNFYWQIQGAGQ